MKEFIPPGQLSSCQLSLDARNIVYTTKNEMQVQAVALSQDAPSTFEPFGDPANENKEFVVNE